MLQGGFLEGFFIPDAAAEFDQWMDDERKPVDWHPSTKQRSPDSSLCSIMPETGPASAPTEDRHLTIDPRLDCKPLGAQGGGAPRQLGSDQRGTPRGRVWCDPPSTLTSWKHNVRRSIMDDASRTQIPRTAALVGIVAALAGAVHSSSAQGCEPIRFTNPNFGVQGWTQQARQWRLTIGYRYLYSDQWFVGSSEASGMEPGGRAPIIRSHTFVADLEYAPNERLAVHFSVPVSTGSIRRVYPLYDSAYHRQHASGIGDASVSADLWLVHPPR